MHKQHFTILNCLLEKASLKHYWTFIIIFFVTVLTSCKKDKSSVVDCIPNTSTSRQILNSHAIIKEYYGKYFIVEEGTIDTKLNPCNLTEEFQVDNLQVTVSGEVKFTPQTGVCCTENFVITRISR